MRNLVPVNTVTACWQSQHEKTSAGWFLTIRSITQSRKKVEHGKTEKREKLTYTHLVNLRLTDTQYDIITEADKQADLSLSKYIRTQLMKGKVSAKYGIVADVPELKKLIAHFGKIGSNLNQLARHFNQGGIHSQEMQKRIHQFIAEIYEMKYDVAKMAGEFLSVTK